MKTSDLSLLRGMLDAGNEEAGNRLAELAAGRGDVAELRWLVDAGNEEGGNRLVRARRRARRPGGAAASG